MEFYPNGQFSNLCLFLHQLTELPLANVFLLEITVPHLLRTIINCLPLVQAVLESSLFCCHMWEVCLQVVSLWLCDQNLQALAVWLFKHFFPFLGLWVSFSLQINQYNPMLGSCTDQMLCLSFIYLIPFEWFSLLQRCTETSLISIHFCFPDGLII